MEACIMSIKESFEKTLDKKVNLSKIRETLDEIQELVTQAVTNKAILREVEIKLGTKKEGLISALDRLRNENKEYY